MAEIAALALGPPFYDWFNWDGNPEPPLTIWLVLNQFPKNARADARLKKLYFGERKLIDGEWKWCEPFIPRDEIETNPDNNYQNVTLKNGTVIIVKSTMQSDLAMASDNVDLIVIDEPTEDEKWGEFVSRLIASPIARLIHGLTDAWLTTDYLDHVLESDESDELDVERFDFTTAGNPHVDLERVKNTFKLQTQEQRRVREMGMRKKTTLLCYPKVFRWLDEYTGREIKNERSPAGTGNFIREFPIPKDWTRYVIHDPGVKVCATMWFAVEDGTQNIYGYRCCYIRNPGGNVERIMEIINRANAGDEIYTWYMDPKAAKHTPRSYATASSLRTMDLYQLASNRYGINWAPGPQNLEVAYIEQRIYALTGYLDPQNTSVPMMYFFDVNDALDPANGIQGMDALKQEFKHYRWEEDRRRAIREKRDAIYCCEAAASIPIKWRGKRQNVMGGWDRVAPRRDPVTDFMNGSRPMNWREEP